MSNNAANQFLEIFRSLFQDGAVVSLDTCFRELEEWSSMQSLIVIAAIDEHYGVTIAERDFRSATTVSDLHRLSITK